MKINDNQLLDSDDADYAFDVDEVDHSKAISDRTDEEFYDEGTVPEEVIPVDASDEEVYVRPSSQAMR